MNKLYDKALKANVARTEIAGDVNTKWTPDAIKIKKEKDKKEPTLEEAYNAIVKGLGILNGFDDGNRDKPKKEKKKPKKKKLWWTNCIQFLDI